MPQLRDRSGLRCGRLVAISPAGSRARCALWKCRCDCGSECIVAAQSLQAGNTRSCGCLYAETRKYAGECSGSHNGSKSAEYGIWADIKKRCTNPKTKNFSNYGGRGITVCERWRDSFANFLADMGERPSDDHSIDRINNDGNYEPGNCRWATRIEQSYNKRNTCRVQCGPDLLTIPQIMARDGLSYSGAYKRYVTKPKKSLLWDEPS